MPPNEDGRDPALPLVEPGSDRFMHKGADVTLSKHVCEGVLNSTSDENVKRLRGMRAEELSKAAIDASLDICLNLFGVELEGDLSLSVFGEGHLCGSLVLDFGDVGETIPKDFGEDLSFNVH